MKQPLLLINPWIHDFAAYDFWMKPLGLLYLASFLRLNRYSVEYIDCLDHFHPLMKNDDHLKTLKRTAYGTGHYYKEKICKPDVLKDFKRNYSRYGIKPQYFIELLKRCRPPRCILVTSMMTYWYPGVFETIRILKETMPGIPIILGGNYVSLCTEHAKQSGADYLLPGGGEEGIMTLIRDILDDKASYRPDGNELDSLPYPAFDLLHQPVQLPLMTSRGCPFRCSYCASHLLNTAFRRRDPIRVVDEIEFWSKRFGIQHFSFYDDALLLDPDELFIPMAREMIRRRLSCRFHCPNGLHLRKITDESARLLFRSGFKTIRFGFETSEPQRQIDTGGKVRNEDLQEAVIHLKNAGYETQDIGIYLLCGLPGQTAEEVEESVRYVSSCGARPVIAEYSPIPGTALWDASIAASPFNIREEPLYQNNSLLPCRSDRLTYDMYQRLKRMTRNPMGAS